MISVTLSNNMVIGKRNKLDSEFSKKVMTVHVENDF